MSLDIKARIGGIFLVALGVVMAWFFILGPLQEARNGAEDVSYSLKIFVAVPACVIAGLAFLVRGSNLVYRNVEGKTLTAVGWAMFAVVALLTAAGYWWFQQQFAALGYSYS
jgi:hypothetical protein